MRKSCIGDLFLHKWNGTKTLKFIRHLYQTKFLEMHQQHNQGQFKNQYYGRQTKQRKEDVNGFRKWINLNSCEQKDGQTFTIQNYNLLSQKLLEQHSYLYSLHEPTSLRWDLRLNNVIEEIFRANPSILCCQVKGQHAREKI